MYLDQEIQVAAKVIVGPNFSMTLGTADEEGQPWKRIHLVIHNPTISKIKSPLSEGDYNHRRIGQPFVCPVNRFSFNDPQDLYATYNDMVPEAGRKGSTIKFEGTLEELRKTKPSITSVYSR